MKKTASVFCAILLLLLAVPLAACGAQDGKAASVRLARTQGSVSVWDESEKALEPRADLGLYDGYRMATDAQSYGWLSLDKERLAKLDAQSEAAVTRAGRQLELTVNAGSLFFNIETPLEADETLDIRTSNMVVGIRGTCGWVSVTEAGSLRVCLLEGAVECTVTQDDGETDTQTVRAGEQGELFPDGGITVTPLCREDVPDFVLEELTQEPELTQTLPARGDGAGPAGAGDAGDGLFADGAGDADPLAPYAEALAAMPVSDGTTPGLLYTELLDFDADGFSELLVITVEDPPEGSTSSGTYIAAEVYMGRIAEDSVYGGLYTVMLPGDSLWLAAIGDGRLFLDLHTDNGDGDYGCAYYGPAFPQEGGWYQWGSLRTEYFFPQMGECTILDWPEQGGDAAETQLAIAEYQSPFADLHLLISYPG